MLLYLRISTCIGAEKDGQAGKRTDRGATIQADAGTQGWTPAVAVLDARDQALIPILEPKGVPYNMSELRFWTRSCEILGSQF